MEYILKLSQQDTQLIISALAELPLKLSINVFGNIQRQVHEQDSANAIHLKEATSNA
ncbi:MAG TPA: hypothetical protein VF783_14220 [Terriglobales bacterium]